MKRSYLIGVVIVIAIAVGFFPTPHLRTKQDLVENLGCTLTLEDGDHIDQGWVDIQNPIKIIIDIQSTEEVEVELKSVSTTIYFQTGTVHAYTGTSSYASYTVSVTNPTLFATGSSAYMTGSIKAYHVYEVQQWVPWWMQ